MKRLFVPLGITHTLHISDRLFHLIIKSSLNDDTSLSDSTWVITLCLVLELEAFRLY